MRHLSSLCPSAPLPPCVKIISSQSRDSFPNLVNPVNPVKKVRLSVSVPLCLCASVLILSQRLRDTEFSSSSSAPLRLNQQPFLALRKLFSKIGRLCGELLEMRENENLVRKILKRNGEWEMGSFIQTF